ncbi:MAG TPA: RuvA C-terminal domain-containing protein [Polyangiaceae bacterium]|jgi:hypothetical protein|nr:RuvA C-terminal domain-containing protein [Polyangiaceae bacterium]
MNKLKRSGTPLDDDSALMLMARHVLGGPADAGRASYQIALSVCPTCDRGYQHASGQHIGVITTSVAGAEPAKGESAHVGARRAKDERAHVGAEPAKDECAHVGAALIRAIGGVRAKQTVSPATRRAVRRRAAHRGELVVSGSVASGIRFRHADGNDYGKGPQPSAVEMQAKAFAALRGLGFREGEVRRALAESCELGVPEMNLERVVRGALARLTPQPVHI